MQAGEKTSGETVHGYGGRLFHRGEGIPLCGSWDLHFHKEKRKRIFVELTDSNQYKTQLYKKLYPSQHNPEILSPVYMTPQSHEDYTNVIGISLGMWTMLTTDSGNRYDEELGAHLTAYTDWTREQTGKYNSNQNSNPGRADLFINQRKYI